MSAAAPQVQRFWDDRAAANFVFGGTGSGLAIALAFGFVPETPARIVMLIALALVGLGLFCVWLEIGKPLRFLNVYRHARTSWMTREAMAGPPLLAAGLAAAVWGHAALFALAGTLGLVFLYCQARILKQSIGIPAWRAPSLVPVIVATGLAEGAGILAMVAGLAGWPARDLAVGLGLAVAARGLVWRAYRARTGPGQVPTAAARALDRLTWPLLAVGTLVPLVLIAAVWLGPTWPLALAGLASLVTGWLAKYAIVIKAAHRQGFALGHTPARGGGKPGAGTKPGWA